MIDRWIVYCSRQREIVHRRFGVDDRRILLTPFMVDGAFFAPDRVDVRRRRMICAVGLERRDYPTLVDAVDGLDVEVVIAAASPWSRRADTTSGRPLPSNVTVRSYTQFELRELYAESAFSVMPLDDVDFQAGITAILESMAMERPVICTRTRGQTDTIVEGVTGRYVPPADALALRRAIAEMLEHDDSVARMGIAARDWVLEHADVAVYADRLAALVASVVVRPASD